MKKGFTLVEVMIAAALLAMSLSLFIGSFVSSKRSAVIADKRVEALNIAREEMERLLSSGYSAISAGSSVLTNVPAGYEESYYIVQPNSNYPNTRDVAMTVSWVNPTASATSSITLYSSISMAMDRNASGNP